MELHHLPRLPWFVRAGVIGCLAMGSLGVPIVRSAAAITLTSSAHYSSCTSDQVQVSTQPGLNGAGHWGLVIQFANTSRRTCALEMYPRVGLLDEIGSEVVQDSPSALGLLSASAPRATTVMIQPGQVASSALGGTDVPVGGASTCPAYPFTIALSGWLTVKQFGTKLDGCSGIYVGPFVLGFNGQFVSGQFTGTAPTCRAGPAGFVIGPMVQINVWVGSRRVDFTDTFTSPTKRQHYQLVLQPGHYLVGSSRQQARQIIIRAGRLNHLGLFGTCSQPPKTFSTIPGAGEATETTSTTTTPTTACSDNQITVAAKSFGQAGGAASEVIEFTNVGSTGCTLYGYPGVAALNSQGDQVEQATRRLTAMMGGQYIGTEPVDVALQPGQVSTATVEGSDNPIGSETCPYYPALLITIPGGTRAVTLRSVGVQGPHFTQTGFPGCTSIVVTPIVPGSTGTNQ